MILTPGFQRCPAHHDQRPSLSITRAPDRWLLNCFAGCRTEAILHATGLTWADLYDRPAPSPSTRSQPRHWRDELLAPLLGRERRMQQKLEPWVPVFRINDFIRTERQRIAEARVHVTAAGDTDVVWHVLDVIATRERFVNRIEVDLDDALMGMRST
jgi:hypothetical protein